MNSFIKSCGVSVLSFVVAFLFDLRLGESLSGESASIYHFFFKLFLVVIVSAILSYFLFADKDKKKVKKNEPLQNTYTKKE